MRKSSKNPNIDKDQSSIFDFGDNIITEEEKKVILQPIIQPSHESHKNHIVDSEKLKEDNVDDKYKYLRSEQIIVSKDNYPSIQSSDNKSQFIQSIESISNCNHKSKNILNQCIYQIRQAFFNKIDQNVNYIKNANIKSNNDKEKQLRINIRSELNKYKNYSFEKLQISNYKNSIYKLLDKYFKDQSKNRSTECKFTGCKINDNYSWSPQSAQQTIDMSKAWLDNDLGRRDYQQHPEHRCEYTGEPGLPFYRQNTEYISVFTNQQCKIETKSVLILESMNEDRLRYTTKNFLTFPDHLNIKSIETRLSDKTDLREVRIIPQAMKNCYKIEIVYKKVIDKTKIKLLNLDPNRIIGIDTGQENVVTIADNIGLNPIIVKGGILLSINQSMFYQLKLKNKWFDKIGSKLYEIYYRQQDKNVLSTNNPKENRQKIVMGNKMKILSQNRYNKASDILHKISRYIINHCIKNRIGTIVWGRNPGWKQRINLGKKTNQKFTKIPHYLLFQKLKYKAEEIGIKIIDIEESHTSKCSFLDNEPICHHDKYMGKRTKRGLFRSSLGTIINADVNAAYNMIRKVYPKVFPEAKSIGIADVVLHPIRLSIKNLLSSGRPNS